MWVLTYLAGVPPPTQPLLHAHLQVIPPTPGAGLHVHVQHLWSSKTITLMATALACPTAAVAAAGSA